MPNWKPLIQELRITLHDNLQINLEDLPCDFYESDEHLLIKAGFPIHLLETLATNQIIKWEYHPRAHLTQLPGYGLKNIRNAIAIASGKGGVGKSTVSCNLVTAAASIGASVGLLDADIYGPSIPTMMGLADKPLFDESLQAYLPVKNHGVECMSMGLLQEEGPLIWRGPMLAKALMQMLNQTAWSLLDYLFIDLPPGTGDIPLSLTQKIPLSGAIIVTTPQTIATLDAEKALQMFLRLNIPVLGIINNMAMHECENCHHQSSIFGEDGAHKLAQKYQVPILGTLPLNSAIRLQADKGKPIASIVEHPLALHWQKIALNTCIQLAKRPLNQMSKMPPVRVE
jgi:ATP-binding protein involved in chromosome partitioning